MIGAALGPDFTDVEMLRPLLVAATEGTIVHHPVDRAVGNVRNDTAEFMDTVALDGNTGQNSLEMAIMLAPSAIRCCPGRQSVRRWLSFR